MSYEQMRVYSLRCWQQDHKTPVNAIIKRLCRDRVHAIPQLKQTILSVI